MLAENNNDEALLAYENEISSIAAASPGIFTNMGELSRIHNSFR